MDISILRKKPEDRIRTIRPIDGDPATVDVKFAGSTEYAEINRISDELQASGVKKGDSFNIAFGRVVVLGWSGIYDTDDKGKKVAVAFTPENCDFLMVHSGEFRQSVISAASSLKDGAEKN
jgi:hypothetical protein